MKFSLMTFLAALVALVTSDCDYFRKRADSKFLEKQQKVLEFFIGLGAVPKPFEEFEEHPFLYDKPEFYMKHEALDSFMKVYKRGLLDRGGVFTLLSRLNREDTYKVFNLFYYAKDFNTFHDIASWARIVLHPLQFGYAFTMAVFHREDTRGLIVPPLYEIIPHYFVQNEIMHQAITAKRQGETYGKFDVNNTGWEWSWHADMLTGPYKSSSKWVGADVEMRMSYFREDVGLANFLTYMNMKFAKWLSNAQYPDIHFNRHGELFYNIYKWLKNRYNLERMVNGLSPVIPYEPYEKLPGYNPHIQDNFGFNLLVRQDKLVSEEVNKEGTWDLKQILARVSEIVDSAFIREAGTRNKFYKVNEEGVNGLDEFAKIMFGFKDSLNSDYYNFPFFKYTMIVNDMVIAPNDRDFTSTAMGTTMTQPRDPVFYMILASLDQWFDKFIQNFPAYTKDELNFPGVSLEKLEMNHLDTYFERYNWELTNGITFINSSDRLTNKFEASQFRLNHKPYSYKLYVNSDKEAEVVVRVFLGPKTDVDGRVFSFDQQRRAMITLDRFKTKVKSGENILERNSDQYGYFEDYQKFRPYYEKVKNSIETEEPFYYNELWHCGAPHNLLLPRGSKSGKEFSIFAIITKYDYQPPSEGYFPCSHNYIFDQYSFMFPIDRQVHSEEEFVQPNMIFSSVKIYHDHVISNSH